MGEVPTDQFDRQEKFDLYRGQLAAIRPVHVIGQNERTYLISLDHERVEKIIQTEGMKLIRSSSI